MQVAHTMVVSQQINYFSGQKLVNIVLVKKGVYCGNHAKQGCTVCGKLKYLSILQHVVKVLSHPGTLS